MAFYSTGGVIFATSGTLFSTDNVVAAYGLYKLNPGYTGNAIRVRRSSDNAEANIGFAGDGTLDETALLAHCSTGDGFVTTFYDQYGSYNATQTTAANQPKIVASGVVIKINTSPAMLRPDFSDDRMSAALPNRATYTVVMGAWSDCQAYAITTQSTGSTFLPAGSSGTQLPPFNSLLYYASIPPSGLTAKLAARCQPDLTGNDIFRFQFSSAGAKTLAVTESGSGITFTDSTGTQNTSYSRTVAAFDWLVVRATTPSGITVINWSIKTLAGCLPQTAFALLTKLTTFQCFGNQLTGSIPSLSANTALTTFRCYNNQLTGSIPSLSANTALTLFHCYSNQLTGSIPSLSTNTAMINFNCYGNLLTGSIPSLSANTVLTEFRCETNQLTGSIPSLSSNTALTTFRCYSNQLTGWTGGTVSATLGDFQAQNNLLTQAAVDAILAAFVAAGKASGTRTLNLGGTGNATPSAAGLADKTILVSRGWTVTTN